MRPDEIRFRASAPDPLAELLTEIRELRAALDAQTEQEPKRKNGNGGGWFTRLLAERMAILVIGGMLALGAWIGLSNDRLTTIEAGVGFLRDRVNALPPSWLVERVKSLEDWQLDHMREHPGR